MKFTLAVLIINWFSTLKRLTTVRTFSRDHVKRRPTSWEIDQPLVETRRVIRLTTFLILTTDGRKFVVQFVVVTNTTFYIPASARLTGTCCIIFAGKFQAEDTLQIVVNRVVIIPQLRVFCEMFSDGANLLVRAKEPQCRHRGRGGRVQLQMKGNSRCENQPPVEVDGGRWHWVQDPAQPVQFRQMSPGGSEVVQCFGPAPVDLYQRAGGGQGVGGWQEVDRSHRRQGIVWGNVKCQLLVILVIIRGF